MPVAVSLTCGLLLLLCEATAYPIAMSGLSLGESLQEEVDAAPWLSGPTRKRSRSISINQDLVSLANMVANTDHLRRVEEAKILLNKIGKRDVHGRDVTGTRDITSRRDATGRRDVIGQRDVSGRTLPVRSAGTTAGSEWVARPHGRPDKRTSLSDKMETVMATTGQRAVALAIVDDVLGDAALQAQRL